MLRIESEVIACVTEKELTPCSWAAMANAAKVKKWEKAVGTLTAQLGQHFEPCAWAK